MKSAATVPVGPAVPMESAISVGPAVAVTVETAIAMKTAVPSAETLAPAKIAAPALEAALLSAEIVVATEVLVAVESPVASLKPAESVVPAAEAAVAVKIAPVVTSARVSPAISASEIAMIVVAEAPPSFASVEIPVIVASEVSPSAVVIAVPPVAVSSEVTPPVAVVKIPPAVAIVEVHPSRIVKVESAAVERPPIEPAEPRPCPNEHAIIEPLRPVISVRSARVGRIWIVAVWADRRRAACIHDCRTHANANRHAHMGACGPRREPRKPNHNSHYCAILQQISHLSPSMAGWVSSLDPLVHMARPVPNTRPANYKCKLPNISNIQASWQIISRRNNCPSWPRSTTSCAISTTRSPGNAPIPRLALQNPRAFISPQLTNVIYYVNVSRARRLAQWKEAVCDVPGKSRRNFSSISRRGSTCPKRTRFGFAPRAAIPSHFKFLPETLNRVESPLS